MNNTNTIFGGNTMQNNNTGGLFGGNTNTQSIGGGLFQSNTNNTNTGGLFGGNNNSGSLFGQNNNNSGGLFGQNNNTTQNTSLFGGNNNTSGGLFNQNNNAFNNNNKGLFNNPVNTNTGGLFGNNMNNNNNGGGLFGGNNNTMNTGNSLFGGNQNNNNNNSLFNNPAQQQGGLFGNQPAQNTNQGGLFGNATQPNNGNSLFGGNTGTSLFGNTNNTNTNTNNGGGQYNGEFGIDNFTTKRVIDVTNIPKSKTLLYNVTSCGYDIEASLDLDNNITCEAVDGESTDIEITFKKPITIITPDDKDFANLSYSRKGNDFVANNTCTIKFRYNALNDVNYNIYTKTPKAVKVLTSKNLTNKDLPDLITSLKITPFESEIYEKDIDYLTNQWHIVQAPHPSVK